MITIKSFNKYKMNMQTALKIWWLSMGKKQLNFKMNLLNLIENLLKKLISLLKFKTIYKYSLNRCLILKINVMYRLKDWPPMLSNLKRNSQHSEESSPIFRMKTRSFQTCWSKRGTLHHHWEPRFQNYNRKSTITVWTPENGLLWKNKCKKRSRSYKESWKILKLEELISKVTLKIATTDWSSSSKNFSNTNLSSLNFSKVWVT